MKIKLMAGEMARLHNISKQTLLYYDNIGLFRPREKNDDTGYRYYSLEQCEDLDVILCLKRLGLKLEDIKRYLKLKSTRDRIGLLERQEARILKKIEEINRTRNRLESIITSLKARMEIIPFEMGIRRYDERHIVSEAVAPPYDLYALEMAVKMVLRNARDRYDTDIHELLAYVDISSSNEDLFRKVALQVHSESGDSIAAGDFAYIYHKGTFQTLSDTRQKLTDYIDTSGFRAAGSIIEKILLDSLAVSSESDYLIEIQIPVVKRTVD